MSDFTPQARIARLREWAQAKAAPANTMNLSAGSNVLLGVAMHGLARRHKGATQLTDIENMAVSFFDVIADTEEERNAYGQIFSEAKTAAGSGVFAAANIPMSIMTLSENTPYNMERFANDFKQMAEETMAQPHIRIVPLEQIKPDGTIEMTKDFEAASTAMKRGLTLFAAPPERETKSWKADDLPPRAWIRIKPTQFHCIKESGESGKDEVYFTWGFGSDMQDKVSHRTSEFGSVQNGVVRDFPQDPPFFKGYTQKAIAGHVVCWEADQSSSDWYNKLIQVMKEIADKSSYMTRVTGNENIDFLIGLIPGMSEVGEIAFWLENIATMIAAFLDIFRNHDDKVVEHSFAWNRNLAESLAQKNSTLTLDFNGGGGGHHTVKVQFVKN